MNTQRIRNRSTFRRRGFTLIELLIVIAIIAILAAFLFPTLRGARRKAQEVTCLANVRQIQKCVSLYAEEYDGYFCSNYRRPTRVQYAKYAPTPELFHCPSQVANKPVWRGNLLKGTPFEGKTLIPSYGYNSHLASRGWRWLDDGDHSKGKITWLIRVAQVEKPGNKVYTMDRSNYSVSDGATTRGVSHIYIYNHYKPEPRHGRPDDYDTWYEQGQGNFPRPRYLDGSCNASKVDGSAEPMPFSNRQFIFIDRDKDNWQELWMPSSKPIQYYQIKM